MKLRITLKQTGVALSAAALSLSLTSCGRAIPTGPTPAVSSDLRVAGLTAGETGSLTGTTTTWSCMTSGHSGNSSPANGCEPASTMLRAPAAVAAVVVTGPARGLTGAVSGTTVTLTWLPPISPEQPTSYVIEAGSAPGASNLASFDTGSTATTLTVHGVPSGTYYVRVLAKNSAGTSVPSNEVILSATCNAPPGRPNAHAPTVRGSSVTMTWNAPPDGCAPTHYLLAAASSPGGNEWANISTGSAATTFVMNGAAPGTYYLRVRAANAAGVSAPSNEVVATVGGNTPTGRWVGVAPDGMIADPGSRECPVEWDLEMNLASDGGSTVTGTATTRNRRVQFESCSDVFGFVANYSANGTVGPDGAISLAFGGAFTLSGTLSGNTISGRFVAPNRQPGRFTVHRQ